MLEDDNTLNIITPNHFLGHNPIIALPSPPDADDPEYTPVISRRDQLINAWSNENKLVQVFWKMWSSQYLLSLRERKQTQFKKNSNIGQSVHEKDVVLFKPDKQKLSWRLARVIKLIASHDGLVRAALVIYGNGRRNTLPVRLLYPLEVSE